MNSSLSRMVAALLLSLPLASCGPEPLALPAQPIDRAATCGVVAAAEARLGVADLKAPLPLAAHGRIVGYALLASSASGDYDPTVAGQVSRRMFVLEDKITGADWKALPAACRAAYPLAEKNDVTLPEDRAEAQLQCNEIAVFMTKALEGQTSSYRNEMAAYRHLKERLGDAIAPTLKAKAGPKPSAQLKLRHHALAAASRLGAPIAVLARCLERFP